MASFNATCRLSARIAARQLRHHGARGFRLSAASRAAHNFTMPALSPTMTEGNIASWKVKEGDSFVAGDVLLEIETDKASMDVEAQDDGIVAKIFQGDGTKGIQVGARIAVLAESADDVSTLDIPPEENASPAPPKKEKSQPALKAESKSHPELAYHELTPEAPEKPPGPAKKQTYPFLPSVQYLVKEHHLDASAIDKMTPSGPNNRLLKGDVLAYLGSISLSSPANIQSRFEKLSHLDLSTIKAAALTQPAKPADVVAPVAETVEDLEIAVPVSMKAVLEFQKRIESTLGVIMPLSTFIARATDVANDGLPRSKSYQPSAEELFDQILGVDRNANLDSAARGTFLPQITAYPGKHLGQRSPKNIDVLDILTGTAKAPSLAARAAKSAVPTGLASSVNVFSVKVAPEDKKRAEVFLGRVKTVLESEPGRLVL